MVQELSFAQMLAWQANNNPDHVVFRFAKRGAKQDEPMTYAQLHARALSIANAIKNDVAVGDRVFLLYQPGLEFISALFACFYLGAIPIPAYPPNPKKLQSSVERLNVMIEDSRPSLILTSSLIHTVIKSIAVKDKIQRKLKKDAQVMDLNEIPIINTQKIKTDDSDSLDIYQADMDDTAMLIYTSGSTGHPKGIMVSHRNVYTNVLFQKRQYDGCDAKIGDQEVMWLPHQHSLCLIAFILRPVYLPTTVVLFSPLDFLATPIYWLELITQYQAYQTVVPNFALDFTVEHIYKNKMKNIDLTCLRSLAIGGSAVSWKTIQNFEKALKPYGLVNAKIFPCYGLSETAVGISGYRHDDELHIVKKELLNLAGSGPFKDIELSNEIVSNGGWPKELSQLYIVNPETKEVLPELTVGEIWAKNACIAKGYWEKPEETKETFQAFTADGQGPFLKTGDVGFIYKDELYIVERIKDLIIIRGKNFIPNDIEQAVVNADDRLCLGNVAFSYSDGSDEQLVLGIELDKKDMKDAEIIKKTVSKRILEDFDLLVKDILILPKGTLPRTVSGKIQRQRFKKEYINNHINLAKSSPCLNDDEAKNQQPMVHLSSNGECLADRELLNIIIPILKDNDVPSELISKVNQGQDVMFSDLGFDSLKLMQFYNAILEVCAIEVTPEIMGEDSELFIFDKSIFDAIHSIQSLQKGVFTRRENDDNAVQRLKNIEPINTAFLSLQEDLICNKRDNSIIYNWLERKILAKVVTIKKLNSKKFQPLEKYAQLIVNEYVRRYLSEDIATYKTDIQQVVQSIIHAYSLYASYGQEDSGFVYNLELFIKKKLLQNGADRNIDILEKFKNIGEAKIISFLHLPLDFAAVYMLLKILDNEGVKTGLITREHSYEAMVQTFGFKHCRVWDASTKRATFGLDQMIKEKRIIIMIPDSFYAIYTDNACRFNISQLFPQSQPYVKNRILNDLLHKDLFMYLGEFYQLASHFDVPIIPLSGSLNKGNIQVHLGDEVRVSQLKDKDCQTFIKEVLRPKMPYFLEQFPLMTQLYQVIDYYAGVNEIKKEA